MATRTHRTLVKKNNIPPCSSYSILLRNSRRNTRPLFYLLKIKLSKSFSNMRIKIASHRHAKSKYYSMPTSASSWQKGSRIQINSGKSQSHLCALEQLSRQQSPMPKNSYPNAKLRQLLTNLTLKAIKTRAQVQLSSRHPMAPSQLGSREIQAICICTSHRFQPLPNSL